MLVHTTLFAVAGFCHLPLGFDAFFNWVSRLVFWAQKPAVFEFTFHAVQHSLCQWLDRVLDTVKVQWLGRSEKSGHWRGRTRFASYIATSLITSFWHCDAHFKCIQHTHHHLPLTLTEYEGIVNMTSRRLCPDQRSVVWRKSSWAEPRIEL